MKKICSLTIMSMIVAFGLSSCGAKKQIAQPSASSGSSPFGVTYTTPCEIYDTPTEFTATGIFRGSANQKQEVHKNALLNAQDIVRIKMKHAYKGMVSDYSSSTGNNQGNDIERKMTSAGDRIIDVIVNETSESCLRFGEVQSDGHLECYVSIRIPKQEVAQKVAQEVKDKLSQEEKDRIGFNEQEYRKQMEERFKQYQEDHK